MLCLLCLNIQRPSPDYHLLEDGLELRIVLKIVELSGPTAQGKYRTLRSRFFFFSLSLSLSLSVSLPTYMRTCIHTYIHVDNLDRSK